MDKKRMNNLIEKYFHEGYTFKEIIATLLLHHGVILSIQGLKRNLRKLGLRRRNIKESPVKEIIKAILNEIKNSGSCLGYRSMWKRLKGAYNLKVKRDTISNILKIIDPEGVDLRKRKRFARRKYSVPGPNFIWHIDGYDKLKPFGFAIHGAIDGYSRRILWLKLATSNNNPQVIAYYFLETVKNLNLTATVIRADRGTENVTVSLLQNFLRYFHDDKLSGLKSYMPGKSCSNQRIESWWSQMRKLGGNWWISYFKDLRDQGIYDETDPLHIEILRYCYGPLIQYELSTIMEEWNQHRIRKQRNQEVPSGIPNILYYSPELSNSKDYGKPINIEDVEICANLYTKKPEIHSPLTSELIEMILPGTNYPKDISQAFNLFQKLIMICNTYE